MENKYPSNRQLCCVQQPKDLIYFLHIREQNIVSVYCLEVRFVGLPHWNSSAPSSQSFWPSHSHTLEMQFPLGQAKWPSSHFCPWETGMNNKTKSVLRIFAMIEVIIFS